jgi:hypothetical protein
VIFIVAKGVRHALINHVVFIIDGGYMVLFGGGGVHCDSGIFEDSFFHFVFSFVGKKFLLWGVLLCESIVSHSFRFVNTFFEIFLIFLFFEIKGTFVCDIS